MTTRKINSKKKADSDQTIIISARFDTEGAADLDSIIKKNKLASRSEAMRFLIDDYKSRDKFIKLINDNRPVSQEPTFQLSEFESAFRLLTREVESLDRKFDMLATLIKDVREKL